MNQFKLFAIMLILGACEQPPSAQPQQTSQPQTTKITTNANCKNLHKVTDIDDLLYQMYTNIDSYCLFEMPIAELEKIWGIPIFDYSQCNNDDCIEKLANKRIYFYKYGSGIYLNKEIDFYTSIRYFRIGYTNKYYKEKSTFFPIGVDKTKYKGQYFFTPPRTLPLPKYFVAIRSTSKSSHHSFTYFRWINTDMSHDKPLIEVENDMIYFYENFKMTQHINVSLPPLNSSKWSIYHEPKPKPKFQ